MILGYSEEYYFDFESSDNQFSYMWTDLTYATMDWLWFAISGQRTLYQTDLDIQRGLLVGGGLKRWELTYIYNLGADDPSFMVALSVSF